MHSSLADQNRPRENEAGSFLSLYWILNYNQFKNVAERRQIISNLSAMFTRSTHLGRILTIEEAFGLVIRRLRKERGLSQEQLSQSSSLGRAFISQLERGRQQPTLVTIFELAGALNVYPARILTEIELLLKYNTPVQSREAVLLNYQSWKCSRGDDFLSQFNEYQGRETILLVDDENQLREMLSELLSEFGYDVIVAEDGQHAIDIYKEQHSNIKIVLMDVIMPRKDGIKACQEILAINPAAKVILMSAYTSDCLGNMVPTHFIQKPMAP